MIIMRILHLLVSGGIGGIEILIKNIIQNSKEDNRVCFLLDEGLIYDEMKNQYAENVVFSLKSINFLDKIKKIKEYCINEKIELIILHHQGIKPNLIYAILYKNLHKANVKFVMYVHSSYDQYYNPYKNFLIRKIYKKLIFKTIDISDLIVYISNKVKQTFNKAFNIDLKNEAVVYNGINQKFLRDIKKREYDNQNINIIFVGRLSKEKGVSLLIEAFTSVLNICNNIKLKLRIIGDGNQREELERYTKEKNISKYVEFLGRKEEFIEYLDNSDIFVYPSICEEGFGISVVEAMARGCIPITFNKGGLPEIINNEINGFLINETNSNHLAIGILKVIELIKQGKARNISNNAMATAKKFTIENTVKNINFELEKLKDEEKNI